MNNEPMIIFLMHPQKKEHQILHEQTHVQHKNLSIIPNFPLFQSVGTESRRLPPPPLLLP